MKSKLNDAELIAEAYSKVESLEIQEEALGALAAGIGRGAAAIAKSPVAKKVYKGAGSALKKVATSDTTKKVLRGAGNLARDVAVETGKVAAGKAAGKAVGTLADKAVDAADRGISKLAGETAEDGENMPRINHHDDSEMKMALAELYKIEKYAFALSLMMKDLPALEGWTAAKITKAADYLGSVFHKLDYDFASGEHASMFNVGYEDAMEDGE